MPLLQEAYLHYGSDRLMIVGVDFDEPRELVSEFGAELGIAFPLVLDPGASVQRLYRVRGYPTTFVVDSQGILRSEHIGLLSEAQLADYLAAVGLAR
jgi:peroxiredoxin